MAEGTWRNCNVCKSPIAYGATYWLCSVSTCNQKRTRLHFCTVSCWDAHLPGARHRTAWAEEEIAPSEREAREARDREAAKTAATPARPGPARGSAGASPAAKPAAATASTTDVLIVASRLKQYIRNQSGMNASDRILGPLSDFVRRLCDEAIQQARQSGRETVLDRDVPRDDDTGPAWLSR